jgi:hypothetical protein
MELDRSAKSMTNRLHVSVLVAIGAIAWAITLTIQGIPLSLAHAAPFSAVVGVLLTAGYVFDRWLWRVWLLHGWFVRRPDIRGTWRAELQPIARDPILGVHAPLTDIYIGVLQSFSTLQLHLMTRESESWLLADGVKPSPKGGGYQISGVYLNQPKTSLRGSGSEIHYGAFVLDSHGPRQGNPSSLTGEYWTDRGTRGRMILSARAPTTYTRFEDAEAALMPKLND